MVVTFSMYGTLPLGCTVSGYVLTSFAFFAMSGGVCFCSVPPDVLCAARQTDVADAFSDLSIFPITSHSHPGRKFNAALAARSPPLYVQPG
jgi:hypothetical protein